MCHLRKRLYRGSLVAGQRSPRHTYGSGNMANVSFVNQLWSPQEGLVTPQLVWLVLAADQTTSYIDSHL